MIRESGATPTINDTETGAAIRTRDKKKLRILEPRHLRPQFQAARSHLPPPVAPDDSISITWSRFMLPLLWLGGNFRRGKGAGRLRLRSITATRAEKESFWHDEYQPATSRWKSRCDPSPNFGAALGRSFAASLDGSNLLLLPVPVGPRSR